MNDFKRNECSWRCIGENTVGCVYWCEDCGAIVDEDNSNLDNPTRKDTETYLCPDQGVKAE